MPLIDQQPNQHWLNDRLVMAADETCNAREQVRAGERTLFSSDSGHYHFCPRQSF
jgi:hypothetical protein